MQDIWLKWSWNIGYGLLLVIACWAFVSLPRPSMAIKITVVLTNVFAVASLLKFITKPDIWEAIHFRATSNDMTNMDMASAKMVIHLQATFAACLAGVIWLMFSVVAVWNRGGGMADAAACLYGVVAVWVMLYALLYGRDFIKPDSYHVYEKYKAKILQEQQDKKQAAVDLSAQNSSILWKRWIYPPMVDCPMSKARIALAVSSAIAWGLSEFYGSHT